jgi:hypothetical protein
MPTSRRPPLVALALAAALAAAVPAPAQKPEPVATVPAGKKDFPPGWFPVTPAGDEVAWQAIRDADEKDPKIRLYLPPGRKAVRGVFLCFQFHSADPRHMGRLWDYAVVTVPWTLSWDFEVSDKRSGRYKSGVPLGNTGVLLKYLELAGADAGHPELATAPIVGWLHQDGAKLLPDLYPRCPDRVVAWSDAWPNRIGKAGEITAKVPFVYAREYTGADQKERAAARLDPPAADTPTPAPTLGCRATVYNFPHGVYSRYGYFVSFLDRCIKARVPADAEPGKPVVLKPLDVTGGWVGDYNPVGEWNPIAPAAEAKGFVTPVWMPDEYAAWTWRAYHSNKPDLKVVKPVTEYHGGDRSDCGAGYTKPTPAGAPVTVAAEVKGEYAKVELYDGNRLLGSAAAAPYEVAGVKFERGLHALIAVGITAEGKRVSSRPAFLGVE